ncbi:hypothetical protein ACP70R_013812 [Stipagrostis hirtigluma subsp. patula]
MRFKQLVARRGASAAPTAAIAQPDTSPAEPMASTALDPEGVTAAMVPGEAFGEVTGAAEAADEERKGPKVVDAEEASVYRKEEVDGEDRVEEAAVDTKVAEDARVDETGMEAEELDDEDPVEVELVEASEEEQGANAADGIVQSTLKELGIDELEMSLPDDPDSGGRNKGFAFVQFASHSDAVEAFQRLRKPDAIFGMNRSAKVSFALKLLYGQVRIF